MISLEVRVIAVAQFFHEHSFPETSNYVHKIGNRYSTHFFSEMSSLPPSESTATTQEVRGRPLKALNRNDPIDNAFRLVSTIDVGCVFFFGKKWL